MSKMSDLTFLGNSHLIFKILKRLLHWASPFQDYIILSTDLVDVSISFSNLTCFDLNSLPCNYRKKHACPLDGKCRAENIVYKYAASVEGYPYKFYLGAAEGDFKHRFYNHRISFNNQGHSTDTTLSKYVVGMKKKFKVMPSLKWSLIKSVPANPNISKQCRLCLEKFEILKYPNPNELLNNRSKLISKYRHIDRFLLSNYKFND